MELRQGVKSFAGKFFLRSIWIYMPELEFKDPSLVNRATLKYGHPLNTSKIVRNSVKYEGDYIVFELPITEERDFSLLTGITLYTTNSLSSL